MRKLSPPGVILVPALLVLAMSVSVGCTLSVPPSARPSEATPKLQVRAESQVSCQPPSVDAGILQAAWAYVHERYPAQPWPDDVYLVGDRAAVPLGQNQHIHIVLCSHATGFVWEGEMEWRLACSCGRVCAEEIRELFVAMPGWDAIPTARP